MHHSAISHRWDPKLILYLVGRLKPSHAPFDQAMHDLISSIHFIHLYPLSFHVSFPVQSRWLSSILCGEQINDTHTRTSVWQIITDNKHWSIHSAFRDGLFKVFSKNVKWVAKKSCSEKENKKKIPEKKLQHKIGCTNRTWKDIRTSEWERYLHVYRPLTFIRKMNA